jgi:hypothetical protein
MSNIPEQLRFDVLAALIEGPTEKAVQPNSSANPTGSGTMAGQGSGNRESSALQTPSFLPGLDPGGKTLLIETGAPDAVVTVERSTWPFRVTCDDLAVDARVDATGLTEATLACLTEHASGKNVSVTVTYQDAGDPFRFPRWAQFEVQEESGRLTVSEPMFERDVLAEHLVGRKLRADERRYLLGPIIVDHLGSAWELPAWLRYDAIPRARVAQVVCEAHAEVDEYDHMASLEEAVAVLYTACLSRPLSAEAAKTYFWASAQVLPRYHGAESPEEVLAEIYGPKDVERHLELDEYVQREVLDRIRRDTRKYVVKHQKEREKE